MLAGLIVQAEARGTDMATLRALIEEASNLGAERALARLGLSDGDAGKDLGELRQLLQAWRDATRTARAAVIGWLVRGCLAVLLLGVAVRLGLSGLALGCTEGIRVLSACMPPNKGELRKRKKDRGSRALSRIQGSIRKRRPEPKT